MPLQKKLRSPGFSTLDLKTKPTRARTQWITRVMMRVMLTKIISRASNKSPYLPSLWGETRRTRTLSSLTGSRTLHAAFAQRASSTPEVRCCNARPLTMTSAGVCASCARMTTACHTSITRRGSSRGSRMEMGVARRLATMGGSWSSRASFAVMSEGRARSCSSVGRTTSRIGWCARAPTAGMSQRALMRRAHHSPIRHRSRNSSTVPGNLSEKRFLSRDTSMKMDGARASCTTHLLSEARTTSPSTRMMKTSA